MKTLVLAVTWAVVIGWTVGNVLGGIAKYVFY